MKLLNFLTSNFLSQFLLVISTITAIVAFLFFDGSSSQIQHLITINLLMIANAINLAYRNYNK